MTYALLAWNAILTAFAILVITKSNQRRAESVEFRANACLRILAVEKRIRACLEDIAETQDAQRAYDTKTEELTKHLDQLDNGLDGFAGAYGKFAEDVLALRNDFDALKEEYDSKVKGIAEAETEKAKAEARSEALWQEGLSNLLNYGGELINPEGGYGGK